MKRLMLIVVLLALAVPAFSEDLEQKLDAAFKKAETTYYNAGLSIGFNDGLACGLEAADRLMSDKDSTREELRQSVIEFMTKCKEESLARNAMK